MNAFIGTEEMRSLCRGEILGRKLSVGADIKIVHVLFS